MEKWSICSFGAKKCSIFHNIFKYIIFQRRKGLTGLTMTVSLIWLVMALALTKIRYDCFSDLASDGTSIDQNSLALLANIFLTECPSMVGVISKYCWFIGSNSLQTVLMYWLTFSGLFGSLENKINDRIYEIILEIIS